MAYYDSLDAKKQNKIYEALQAQVGNEAQKMYGEALKKAKTKKQKKACAGQYIGRWYPLLNAWMKGDILNLVVLDALKVGFVPEHIYSSVVN